MPKRALIYGISGQDGHYLSEFLAKKGYVVAGASREKSVPAKCDRHYIADFSGEPAHFLSPLDDFFPDEVYNLAGISSYSANMVSPALSAKVNAEAPKEMLRKISAMEKPPSFFQASTAYMFEGCAGRVNEESKPMPLHTYGRTKLDAHVAVGGCRDKGFFACSGILFNHESPMRSSEYVTGKIAAAAARISLGQDTWPLFLGNLDARRDWGYAGDYVEAMWLMLQQKSPGDYVVATGETHSVRQFCKEAFSHVGLDYEKYVKSDPALFRLHEPVLEADPGKALQELGWRPKVGFAELVCMMVDSNIKMLGKN